MRKPWRLDAGARRDVTEAANWHEAKEPGLGVAFTDVLEGRFEAAEETAGMATQVLLVARPTGACRCAPSGIPSGRSSWRPCTSSSRYPTSDATARTGWGGTSGHPRGERRRRRRVTARRGLSACAFSPPDDSEGGATEARSETVVNGKELSSADAKTRGILSLRTFFGRKGGPTKLSPSGLSATFEQCTATVVGPSWLITARHFFSAR